MGYRARGVPEYETLAARRPEEPEDPRKSPPPRHRRADRVPARRGARARRVPGRQPGRERPDQHAERPRLRLLRAGRRGRPGHLRQRLRPAVRALRLRAQRLRAHGAVQPPLDTPTSAASGAEHPAGRNPLGQVPGVSADRAWKRSVGRPDVQIAILDTGIRWNNGQLRKKVGLNEGRAAAAAARRTAPPARSTTATATARSTSTTTRTIRACRLRTAHDEADGMLDGSDMIAAFRRRRRRRRTATSTTSPGGTSSTTTTTPTTPRATAAPATTARAARRRPASRATRATAGRRLPALPDRADAVWDTFVADTNNFAQAALYAADNDIEVVEGAIGGLFNSRFAPGGVRLRLPARASSSRSSPPT